MYTQPKEQKNHRYLPDETINFVETVFDPTYNGKVTIYCAEGGNKFKSVVTLPISEAPSFLRKMHISKNRGYYITRNCTVDNKRRLDHLFSLQNIVIDIDCHRKGTDHNLMEEKLIEGLRALQTDYFLDGMMPAPTAIVYTGRGAQLWWSFDAQYAPCYREKFDRLRDYWVELVTNSFISRSELSLLSVDQRASKNDVGLARLPGTYNLATGAQTRLWLLSDTRCDFHRWYDSVPTDANWRSKTANQQDQLQSTDKTKSIGLARMAALSALRDYRDHPAGEEQRDIFCLLFYSAVKMAGFSDDTAWEKLSAFNDGFKEPLTQTKLRNVICAAKKNNGYKFRTATIIEWLDITAEEQQLAGLFAAPSGQRKGKHDARDRKRKAARTRRDNKVISLFRDGLNMSAIARIVGICRATVKKIIDAYRARVNTAKEKLADHNKRKATNGNPHRRLSPSVRDTVLAKGNMPAEESHPESAHPSAMDRAQGVQKNGRQDMFLITGRDSTRGEDSVAAPWGIPMRDCLAVEI